MAREFAKPRIIVSRCLGFDYCRYNGHMIPDEFVERLKPYAEFITVCPETDIGLGIPRHSLRLVQAQGQIHLMQSVSERDVTDELSSYSVGFLAKVGEIDGFILKSRSPSCGIKDGKVYPGMGKAGPARPSAGIFGAEVLRARADLAIEDEGRLKNEMIMDHFLKKVFTFARFREVEANRSINELIRFHSENKFLLMSYSQKDLRILGNIVANRDKRSIEEVAENYRRGLRKAMSSVPRPSNFVNAATHLLGYFSEGLNQMEKELFLQSLARYRDNQESVSVPTMLLRSWAARFGAEYVKSQTLLNPYPSSLAAPVYKGEARDLKPADGYTGSAGHDIPL